MMNFNFYNPTRLLFGSGKIGELGAQKLPGKKALLLISAGKSTKVSGALDKTVEQLKAAGVEYVTCANIRENPTKELVMEAAEAAKANGCDFIVALGGGAVLDSAVAVAAMATNFPLFLRLAWPVQLLILLGIGIQFVLLVFFLLCMFKSDLVLGMSRGVIRFLGKLHLVRDPAAKEEKIHHTVEQYAQCVSLMAGSRRLFLEVLALNLAQRVVQMLITCFVCTAVPTGLNFGQVLARQAFCLTGSNSIPLPGSVGAFEYLYIGIFGLDIYPDALLPSMMTARGISYYLCFVICGVMTWLYHIRTGKR